jgi:hypothetical protein
MEMKHERGFQRYTTPMQEVCEAEIKLANERERIE